MGAGGAIGLLFLATILAGPLLFAAWGIATRPRHAVAKPSGARTGWDWRLTVRSSLLYALAFNLAFFLQELFLVLPKALTPGLTPTLFHNNHSWEGEHPLARLFQGTGAAATLLAGLFFAWLLRRGVGRTANARLFLLWMAYHGILMALPQVVIGAIVPQNDVGMAMDYLGLGPGAKGVAALAALAGIVLAALWLTRPLLALGPSSLAQPHAPGRWGFVFRIATLPALVGIALILPFRVPRELVEVIAPPMLVTLVGIAWIQGGAWWARPLVSPRVDPEGSVLTPFLLLVALLLFFQLVLRPGVTV